MGDKPRGARGVAPAPGDDDAIGMVNPMPRRARPGATTSAPPDAAPSAPSGGDDDGGSAQPNEACRLLFGANTPTAPIDAGFPTHTPFDHGELDVRMGRDDLDFNALQRSLSTAAAVAGYTIIAGSAATGIGLVYLMNKITLVKEGEVALTQSYDGTMRVLGRGLHLKDTVGTSVRKFSLRDDVIQHGLVKIIRVLPGHLGLCTQNGKPVLLLAGRHLVNDALFQYVGDKVLTDVHIQIETAHIITVPSDQVGLASVASVAHFLGPGRHAFNNNVFSFIGFRDATEEHITLHSKHRIYVPRSKLGLALLDVEPLILGPGIHNYDNSRFSFMRIASATEEYLNVGSLHRLFVSSGSVALVINDGVGAIIDQSGESIFNSATFEFKGMKAASSGFLRVGAATRILVPAGSLGKVTIAGLAQLLPPGVHAFTEQSLVYDGLVSATDGLIVYGNIKRLLVPQGTWYITYDDGALCVLPPGQHVLTKPSHSVAGELTVGMTVLSLKQVRSMTADNVQLLFDAALSIRIQDPIKAVTMLCGGSYNWGRLTETVLRKADLVLNSCIGQHRFNQAFAATARSAVPTSVFDTDRLLDTAGVASMAPAPTSAAAQQAMTGTRRPGVGDPSDDPSRPDSAGSSFKEQIHKVFMAEFSSSMLNTCGTEIVSMTVEGVSIVDADLAKVMAQGAVARAQLVAATVENEALQKSAAAKAVAVRITAEGAAQARAIEATAAANATVTAAEAEARSTLVRADAEGKRIREVSSAMGAASPAMIQREMLDAAGSILAAMDSNGSRLFVGPDPVASLMAILGGAGAAALSARPASGGGGAAAR